VFSTQKSTLFLAYDLIRTNLEGRKDTNKMTLSWPITVQSVGYPLFAILYLQCGSFDLIGAENTHIYFPIRLISHSSRWVTTYFIILCKGVVITRYRKQWKSGSVSEQKISRFFPSINPMVRFLNTSNWFLSLFLSFFILFPILYKKVPTFKYFNLMTDITFLWKYFHASF
jgi:hypothetical protein